MSGISHLLLLGFTIIFILEGLDDAQSDCKDGKDDDVNGWIVLGFAIGGLVFDAISLLSYKFFGTTSGGSSSSTDPDAEVAWTDAGNLHSGDNDTSGTLVPSSGGEVDSAELEKHDALTCFLAMHISLFHEGTLFHLEPSEIGLGKDLFVYII